MEISSKLGTGSRRSWHNATIICNAFKNAYGLKHQKNILYYRHSLLGTRNVVFGL